MAKESKPIKDRQCSKKPIKNVSRYSVNKRRYTLSVQKQHYKFIRQELYFFFKFNSSCTQMFFKIGVLEISQISQDVSSFLQNISIGYFFILTFRSYYKNIIKTTVNRQFLPTHFTHAGKQRNPKFGDLADSYANRNYSCIFYKTNIRILK